MSDSAIVCACFWCQKIIPMSEMLFKILMLYPGPVLKEGQREKFHGPGEIDTE